MSNLRNFLKKKNCPICGERLNLSFNYKGKRWRIEDQIPVEISFPLPMKNFTFSKKQYAYQPIYYFNVDDNTVSIDFMDVVNNAIKDDVSISILLMTKDYFNNKKDFCFYKFCMTDHYNATTGYFSIQRNKLSRKLETANEFLNLKINGVATQFYNDFINQKSSLQMNNFYQTDLPIVHFDENDNVETLVRTLLAFG